MELTKDWFLTRKREGLLPNQKVKTLFWSAFRRNERNIDVIDVHAKRFGLLVMYLHHSVESQIHINIVRDLLAAGASISEVDRDGKSALMWACSNIVTQKLPSIVQFLISAGADVNQKDWLGHWALTAAI